MSTWRATRTKPSLLRNILVRSQMEGATVLSEWTKRQDGCDEAHPPFEGDDVKIARDDNRKTDVDVHAEADRGTGTLKASVVKDQETGDRGATASAMIWEVHKLEGNKRIEVAADASLAIAFYPGYWFNNWYWKTHIEASLIVGIHSSAKMSSPFYRWDLPPEKRLVTVAKIVFDPDEGGYSEIKKNNAYIEDWFSSSDSPYAIFFRATAHLYTTRNEAGPNAKIESSSPAIVVCDQTT